MSTRSGGGPAAGRWPFVGREAEVEGFARALRDRSCRGICVFGGAGVGKTRLAEECLGLAQGAHHPVSRATATALASRVPLGALAHLLAHADGAGGGDVAAQFAAVVASVHEQAASRRFVLFVDDLPLLDETSAVLVQRLLDAGDTFLLATARAGAAQPGQSQLAGPLEIVRSDRVRRIDLEQHGRAELDAMVVAALGGEVFPATLLALWSVTLGNALFAREIVLAAQARGSLRVRHGVWHLSGRVPVVGQLGDLIDVRLGQLGPDERPPAELLAVAAPVELAELLDRFGAGPVEELERAGVVRIVEDGTRNQVELAHPMYGERMREAMASMTRRRVLADHLAWLDATSAEGGDPVRRAIWRLEALGTADPSLLMSAARVARYAHDYRNVERLARAALVEEPSTAARLILGQALADLGRFEEAEVTLAEAQSDAAGDDELVQAVVARLRNFVWGLLRPAAAEQLARAARQRARSDAARDVLRAALAWALVFSDRPGDALRILEALGTDERRGGELRVIAEACALVAAGRSERAATVARRGREIHIASSADIHRPGTHLATEVFALVECGRLADAFEIGEAGYQVSRQQRHPIGQILFTMTLGRGALVAGTPRTAKRWLAESDALCAKFRFDGPRRIVLSALATANSWLGELDLARQAADDASRLPAFGFMTPEQERGRAWAAVAAGEPNAACAILADAAAGGDRAGHHSSEALLLHDLVRLGRAGDVADRLTELAGLGDAPLLDAYAAHARAAAADDPAGLADAAAAFTSIGALLVAAEAATASVQAWLRRGEARAAATAQARATALARQCEGARTPALAFVAASVALTRREREIAALAAGGVASSAIAADLVLSVRTVNNHLQRAYTKLGVTSRHELRAALDLTDGQVADRAGAT